MNFSQQQISLDGAWKLTAGPQTSDAPREPAKLDAAGWLTIPATVPGNVELDLMAAGRLPDLSVANNIFHFRDFETWDWWYRRRFATPARAAGQRCEIVFDGIDCLAEVWLNGVYIGSADNMLIAHRFDVTGHLNPAGENELIIRIESPVLASRRRIPESRESVFPTNYEGQAIRKAPHMFGWDITPRLVSAGLWRSVRLELIDPTRFRCVYFTTLAIDVSKPVATATTLVDWNFTTDRLSVDNLTLRVRLSDERGVLHESTPPIFGTSGRARIDLVNVRPWWSRGRGEPHLYDLHLDLIDPAGKVVATHSERVGVRTIVLDRSDVTTPDGDGEFVFRINGEKTFIHGTNWVPLDAVHSRDPQFLQSTFDLVVQLNCNMIRCWGGNVYEDHAFFDLCDRHGILVWQDFALACAIYPEDDAFLATMRREAEHIVTKFRNHASLALWAGNNEIDEAFEGSGLRQDPNLDRISREVLPQVVRRLDPNRPYLPSSPYHSTAFFAAGGDGLRQSPEQHLWGYRDQYKHQYFFDTAAHFISEVGYHGCPCRETLAQFLDADHLWPWEGNDQWLTHAAIPHPLDKRYGYRVPLMASQIRNMFGIVPDNLDDFILASQIFQAECNKFVIERMRCGKWRRTGVLWWNLRDGWPIISDAVVDYYDRKKLAYEYIRRVQADVCVMVTEPQAGPHELIVANETAQVQSGVVRVHDCDSARVLYEGPFSVEANANIMIAELAQTPTAAMWIIDWTLSPSEIGARNHFLAGPHPFKLSQYRGWLKRLAIPAGIGPQFSERQP